MRLSMWLAPLWTLLAGAVKSQLHRLVDAIDEQDVVAFKMRLHERIERL